MSTPSDPAGKLYNGLDAASVAAAAELLREGLADVTKLDRQLVGALLIWSTDCDEPAVHAAVSWENKVRSLACPDCPSLLLLSAAGRLRRWRVVHEATCPTWIRYQQKRPGYTALPSGAIVMAGEEPPEGTTRLVSNSPGTPCGAVVTHRGPYHKAVDQEAAVAQAVRRSN